MKRGSVALYLLFSIVLSSATGYGVYRGLRERRLHDASAAPEPVHTDRAAAPSPHPVPAPPVEVEPSGDEPPPLSVAEQRAIDPDIDGDRAAEGANLGMPGIDGAMPRDSVERRFRARLAWFTRCYEQSATPGEDRAVIRVAFHIEPDGTLVDPKITGGFNDGFTACVLGVVGAISFSGPRDGKRVEVVYPIGFR